MFLEIEIERRKNAERAESLNIE